MAGKGGSGSFDRDKTRQCPHCRMEISVLATKCRFCGENVGRPRVEDRHLTMHDLGGASGPAHKVSESMVSALEAFRSEEFSQREADAEDEGKHGRRHGKARESGFEAAKSGIEDLPDLSDSGMALTADIQVAPPKAAEAASSLGPEEKGRRIWLAIIVAIVFVVGVCFGAGFGASWIRAYLAPAEPKPVTVQPENPAEEILRSGGSGLAALGPAMDALKRADNDANRKIADLARERVAEEFRLFFQTDAYDPDRLQDAARFVDRAIAIDRQSKAVRALKAELEEENFAYNTMTIAERDPQAGTVTLNLFYPDRPFTVHKVSAKTGDTVRGRFVVTKIDRDFVRLEDTKRKNRLGKNRVVKLYLDGTVQ